MQTLVWEKLEAQKAALRLAGKQQQIYDEIASHTRADDFKKTSFLVLEGAETTLPDLTSQPGIRVIEIIQKPFSKLRLHFIASDSKQSASMTILRIRLERGASCDTFAGVLEGSSVSLIMETVLEGEQSSLKERTLFLGNQNQRYDIFSSAVLQGADTSAEVESKGILMNSAQARFDGNIRITETAKRSKARLMEHTLLLSPTAKMNAVPGLKIETNDVMATHSASMTRVDDEQLFYAASRGIEEHEAVQMIAQGFLKSLYGDLSEKALIDPIIQKKLCKV